MTLRFIIHYSNTQKAMKHILIILLALVASTHVLATELAIGIQATINSIDIQDPDDSERTIARMTSDMKYYPTVSLLSDEYYFSKDSNVGVQLQFDWSIFKADKQEIGENDTGIDLGTSISGYALSAVPVIFYHFNRHNQDEWNVKLGTGLGLGYLKLKGDYQVTDVTHPDYGKIKQANLDKVGLAVGVYLEANKGNHIMSIYNFSPITQSDASQFKEYNFFLTYKYRINIDDLL
ncbi:hypothetical protein C942_02450 [Photobacterium marinum]|uniref:Outer membrane protein beta-barrel domain-containing protein n=1 Tax=Photobacterium marinum TaxID=1056511 RepID=L8JAE1_9GAMM|nr:hypothetical protein [Photobacterium marinum]ELR64427.1 hypothetical protein C942_02450 [Photobacterium marinum]